VRPDCLPDPPDAVRVHPAHDDLRPGQRLGHGLRAEHLHARRKVPRERRVEPPGPTALDDRRVKMGADEADRVPVVESGQAVADPIMPPLQW